MEQKRFFGLHFDFHAGNDVEIGGRTTVEDIEAYILAAKPDFIQCDCKGHPGNSSYPTKVGKAADKLVADNLRVWVNAAKKHNIPIYMHYSGVLDSEYCKKYPERAAVYNKETGEPTDKISLFDDRYVDEYMIPQIKELITEYGIDGIWVDGDCWGVCCDHSECAKPYLWDGITEEEHKKVMHDAFLRYVKKYTDELHAFAPDFKVISNWAYTSYIPEKIEIDLDCLSGDFNPQNSVHEARYEARCMALRETPWDLMAWGFSLKGWADKPAVQLMQEAAMPLTLGGGFQSYTCQNKDGSAPKLLTSSYRELGEFVRARRFLYEKKPIAQVALLYSGTSYYKNSAIFNAAGVTRPLIGTLNAVLDAQYTANILYEYQTESFKDYEAIIIPEWKYIPDDVKTALADYAKAGGYLIVVGEECCRQFSELFGSTLGEKKEFSCLYVMHEKGNTASIVPQGVSAVSVLDVGQGKNGLYSKKDIRDKVLSAYRVDAVGKGAVAYVPFDFGGLYFANRNYILFDFIKTVIAEKCKALVELNYRNVDLTMQESENGVILNLVNMRQGRHELNYVLYDEVPAIHDVEIKINKKYNKVSAPLGDCIEVETGADYTLIRLKRLDVHTAFVLEN